MVGQRRVLKHPLRAKARSTYDAGDGPARDCQSRYIEA